MPLNEGFWVPNIGLVFVVIGIYNYVRTIIAGVILTLLFPLISGWFSSITISLPSIGFQSATFDGRILSWILIAGCCVTIAINAYDLTLSRLSLKQSTAR